MADHVPFVTGDDGASLAKQLYGDSDYVRVPLDRAGKLLSKLPKTTGIWLDPCTDGLDDAGTRQDKSWFEFMSDLPNFDRLCKPANHLVPNQNDVNAFVEAALDRCLEHQPRAITVPQIPIVDGSDRNKINKALAVATGRWKGRSKFSGRLIFPLVFMNQEQVNQKTARNPKVKHADRCYHEAQADGLWVVDKSLTDDTGSTTLRNRRFPGLIALHQELNEQISTKMRIAGPYWGMNLVLWARGLIDYPAIGIGNGYQYFLAGGHARQPSVKLVIPSLRRRVGVGAGLRAWLDAVVRLLSPSHPAYPEFDELRKQYDALSEPSRARSQVAKFYKAWFDRIAAAPKGGRSMALFQDLSAAYALGKSLPEFDGEGTGRRPEAVVEPLMLSCL